MNCISLSVFVVGSIYFKNMNYTAFGTFGTASRYMYNITV